MPKLLPVVNLTSESKGFLQDNEICIKVESLEWFDYLQTHKSFSVEMHGKRFTACKKTRSNGFTYWNLKGWDGTTNHHIYVGKTDQITIEKLKEAVDIIWEKCNPNY